MMTIDHKMNHFKIIEGKQIQCSNSIVLKIDKHKMIKVKFINIKYQSLLGIVYLILHHKMNHF